jgi:hypothetical protein
MINFLKKIILGLGFLLICTLNSAESSAVSTDQVFDSCPEIAIYCADDNCCKVKRHFGAMLQMNDQSKEPTFKWELSSGKVITGQGDRKIEVDACQTKEPLEVKVKIGNVIPIGCPTTASYKMDCSGLKK